MSEVGWSQCQNICGLLFRFHQRGLGGGGLSRVFWILGECRVPTQHEASKMCGIPQTTIR